MSRTKGSSGPRTQEAIRREALRLIYAHGYEGMSLRDLAKEVGILQGSLYNHIETKQALLFSLMEEHMKALLKGLDEELNKTDDPVEQLTAFITFHVEYHMDRREEVYTNNSELRSLEPENLKRIRTLRRAYEKRVIEILDKGVKQGRFKVGNTKVAAFALIAMLTGVCNWYKPGGTMSRSELVSTHTAMALRGLMAA
jgi:AcrR family transcriptional regulator